MAINKKAVTIMEILVSCILISLCVSGLSATFIWAKRTNVVSQRQVAALDFAKDTLEEVLINNYTDPINMTVGLHNVTSPDFDESELKTNFFGNRTYAVSLFNDGVTEVGKQIHVIVNWTEETGNQTQDLYGLVLKP